MSQTELLRFEWRQARRRASQSRIHGDRAGELIATGQAEALFAQVIAEARAASEPSETDSPIATTTPEN